MIRVVSGHSAGPRHRVAFPVFPGRSMNIRNGKLPTFWLVCAFDSSLYDFYDKSDKVRAGHYPQNILGTARSLSTDSVPFMPRVMHVSSERGTGQVQCPHPPQQFRGPMSYKIGANLIQGQSTQILGHGFDIVLSPKLSEEFICAVLSDIPHR